MDRRAQADDRHLMLLLSFGLRADSNCLDVGASKGLFLNEFRRVAPLGHHLAYEPLPHLCAELRVEYPEVDIRQMALSDVDGQSSFVHVQDPDLEGYSGLRERPYPREVKKLTISVATERLDGHAPDGWLPDFVKIDVEGGECLVITGGIETLRRAKPVLAFEHGWRGSEQYGYSDADLYNLICKDAGLRLFDMDGRGPNDLSRFTDDLASGDRWNWIAHA